MIIILCILNCMNGSEKVFIDPDCVICMETKSTHVIEPCMHLCMCSTCVRKVNECPKCRYKIKARTKHETPIIHQTSIGELKRTMVRKVQELTMDVVEQMMRRIGQQQILHRMKFRKGRNYIFARNMLETSPWDPFIAGVQCLLKLLFDFCGNWDDTPSWARVNPEAQIRLFEEGEPAILNMIEKDFEEPLFERSGKAWSVRVQFFRKVLQNMEKWMKSGIRTNEHLLEQIFGKIENLFKAELLRTVK